MKLLIAIIVAGLIALLGIGGYFYFFYNSNPEMPISEMPISTTNTNTQTDNVDDLDKELTEMETDDTSEILTPNDYSGL